LWLFVTSASLVFSGILLPETERVHSIPSLKVGQENFLKNFNESVPCVEIRGFEHPPLRLYYPRRRGFDRPKKTGGDHLTARMLPALTAGPAFRP
jgi:hypothetical protein